MSSRCESRQRIYTELCNRSSSSSHGIGHLGLTHMQRNCDMSEDYWEDASVSLRSCHSWEATSSPWLGGTSSSACEKIGEEDHSTRFSGLNSLYIRPRRCSFDANEYVASLKGRRSFPPPLASCSTLSIKEGGRFVLKEMDADRPQGFFRAQRGNGRLRLELILPDETNGEEDSHDESSSPVEETIECVECGYVEHGAHVEETITGTPEGCSTADEDGSRSDYVEKVGSCESFDVSEGLWDAKHVCKVEVFEAVRPTVQNVVPRVMEINECSTSQDAGMDVRYAEFDKSGASQQVGLRNLNSEGERRSSLDGFFSDDPHRDISNCGKEAGFLELDSYLTDNFLAFSKLELNQFVTDGSNSNAEQEPLWNVDARNQALAGLSPWSANQICLHQSIVRTRPALGLAMS